MSQELDSHLKARQSDLHVKEAPDGLAMHLDKVIHTAIASLNKDKRIEVGGELTQITQITQITQGTNHQYKGSTEAAALDLLASISAKIKVPHDESNTRRSC